MRKAKARGVGIAIGSDAHSPKDQGGGFDVVLSMLDECGVNEVVFPVAGRLARVVLRATREHLEAHAQRSPEPVQPGSSITGFSRAELGLPEQPELASRAARESAKARARGRSEKARPAVQSARRRSPPAPRRRRHRRSARAESSASSKAASAKKIAPAKKPSAPAKKPHR